MDDPAIPADFSGFLAVVKRDCPTCLLVEPVLQQLDRDHPLLIYSQDDPAFPPDCARVIDDRALDHSLVLDVEIVPTLIRVEAGVETDRLVGWHRGQWRDLTAVDTLGEGLPEMRPGCGSLTLDPAFLARREGGAEGLQSPIVVLGEQEDAIEACFERGWTDGLPVVPPTPDRVRRMLSGTRRAPDELIGQIPPNLTPCTVEHVAINAVMAGCRPEYMPVVLAAVEAALQDAFCMHGLLATTYFSGPVVIVNGPVARQIAMNSGVNALGQGNRANATIGRALQLVIRNMGGGRPGEVDRAALGNPGKYTFCFAEDEQHSPWESLAVERGFAPDVSTVALFAGDGVQGFMDQLSRDAESLARSLAMALTAVCHPKLAMAADALLVISPEHARVFREANWRKSQLKARLTELLTRPGAELVRGAGGIAEGIPEAFAGADVPKFRPDGLHIVHAGGTAGLFSAIIGGWPASGTMGSQLVLKEIVL